MQSEEILVLAVFQSTPTKDGRLTSKAFKNPQLRDGNVSVSRLAHTTRQVFDTYVVGPKAATDPIQGVLVCSAEVLRGLHFDVPNAALPTQIRGVCVLDKVEEGDHDGHAALEYCEEQAAIQNQTTKATLRARIAVALASAFGEIRAIDAITFNHT